MRRVEKVCVICGQKRLLFSKGRCKGCCSNKQPLRSSKAISISEKQKERLESYMLLRERWLEAFPICQCCASAPSTEIHHKSGRKGNHLFINFLAVCRLCHNKIEAHPEWAREEGWTMTRLN